ncbi:hypothetical protein CsSME_00021849 [Camellia sinensis var. sinensis]
MQKKKEQDVLMIVGLASGIETGMSLRHIAPGMNVKKRILNATEIGNKDWIK